MNKARQVIKYEYTDGTHEYVCLEGMDENRDMYGYSLEPENGGERYVILYWTNSRKHSRCEGCGSWDSGWCCDHADYETVPASVVKEMEAK